MTPAIAIPANSANGKLRDGSCASSATLAESSNPISA